VVTTRNGAAFGSAAAAQREVNRLGFSESHEVVPVDGGFVGRKKQAQALYGKAQVAINSEASTEAVAASDGAAPAEAGQVFPTRDAAMQEGERIGGSYTVEPINGAGRLGPHRLVIQRKLADATDAPKGGEEAKKQSAKEYLAEVAAANERAKESAKNAPRKIIEPAKDTPAGVNANGDKLYDLEDGTRYAMRHGRPDFGGDLAPAGATHADPGQAPEPATPAVVAQSVQEGGPQ